jgi:F-type H+-transporting ATPase subunit b
MRSGWLGIAVLVALLSASALLPLSGNRALAQHATGSKAEAASAASHEGEKAPGVFEVVLDLTIWTIVVFAILFLVLRAFAWKPMLEGLQKREENIRGALEDAQRARDEAQKVRQDLKTEMDHASEKVRDLLDAGRRDAERSANEMVAKARSEIQGERERLRKEIDTARDQALQHIWNQTAQLATVVSAKAIRRNLSLDDHRRLVDEALAELNTTGGKL